MILAMLLRYNYCMKVYRMKVIVKGLKNMRKLIMAKA